MNNFDFPVVVFIIVFSLSVCLVCNLILKSRMERLLITICIVGLSIYSGIGIGLDYVSNKYIFTYIWFILAFALTLVIILRIKPNTISIDATDTFSRLNFIIVLFGVIYILIPVLRLIYPEFRLFELFSSVEYRISSAKLFARYARQTDLFYSVTEWTTALTRPFYFLLLFRLRKKPWLFITLLVFPIYAGYVFEGYINRSTISMWLAFIILYLYIEKYINRRMLVIIVAFGSIFLIQMSYILFQFRSGGQINFDVGFFDMLSRIIGSEVNYPQYYEIANSGLSGLTPVSYLKWLVFLPIPNIILGSTPMSLNQVFTYMVRGTDVGDYDYYIVLPSIMGEGIMLYGDSYSWIHAILIALIIGVFINYIKNVRELKYWYLFIVLWLLLGFRGGSQAVIAQLINSSILLIIVYFITSITRSGKNKPILKSD